MDSFEAERERRRIEADFEAMGVGVGMETSCGAYFDKTSVHYEDQQGNYHSFEFAPMIGDEESLLVGATRLSHTGAGCWRPFREDDQLIERVNNGKQEDLLESMEKDRME